ncbi:MAG TPA: hypothetical protein VHS78_08370 [Candidatus Elarobacter sp.]|jgi:hypothetical protein|nr:hypothetical protein [Candidatus Elarobacter sp.]
MTTRSLALALAACALAPLPCAAAGQQESHSVAVAIARTAGTCPKSIAVQLTTHGYEGGVNIEIRPQTAAVAFVSELVSATPQRVVFRATLRPAYASCRGKGRTPEGDHSFVLANGSVDYVLTPVKGPNATWPVLLDLSSEGPNPRLKIAFSD